MGNSFPRVLILTLFLTLLAFHKKLFLIQDVAASWQRPGYGFQAGVDCKSPEASCTKDTRNVKIKTLEDESPRPPLLF